MDLDGGYPIVNVGVPIGTVIMWAVANPPPGYLVCDGSAFTASQYPELAQVLGVTNVPNLVGQFIRGAGAGHSVGTKRGWTTGRPKATFITSGAGGHSHKYTDPIHSNDGHGFRASSWDGTPEAARYPTVNGGSTSSVSDHTHNILGGDAETAPDHYCLFYVIKAADIAHRVRI
jgi:hypothetical protein